jgi:hypothetical protein
MSQNQPQYKTWTWSHPVMLHWMINPGLAINEVFLGQRVPRKLLIEKDAFKSLSERTLVPCPHCDTLHSATKWSTQNNTAFANWFGLYCDHCGNTIPCLHNITSFVLWGISYPFWAPFRKAWKIKWLAKQKQRFAHALDLSTPPYNWVQEGMGFGFLIYIFNGLFFPLVNGEAITDRGLAIGIPPALIGGLLYGYTMWFFVKRPRQNKENSIV